MLQQSRGIVRGAAAAACLVALLLGGCEEPRQVAELAPAPPGDCSGIIGGELETGWPGIGALTWNGGGSFCTGTLIDPEWVLTAAHCVDTSVGNKRFFVGDDASNWSNGDSYVISQFIIHPDWDGEATIHDIALVQLASAVPSSVATPYPINQTSMSPGWLGDSVFYAGYGSTDYYGGSNELKYSAYNDITYVGVAYSSEYDGSLVCSGDSGGPGMLDVDSETVVIGVNSTVANYDGEDPCHGTSNHTRVDIHAAWINSYLGVDGPDCNEDLGLCICDAACQPDGTCDESFCGTESCAWTHDCIVECELSGACQETCEQLSSSSAWNAMWSMVTCYQDHCLSYTDWDDWYQCLATQCESQVATCYDLDPCDILGGDCGSEACYVAEMGLTDCFSSEGIAYGEPCTPGTGDGLACADGHFCMASPDVGPVCHKLCRTDDQCADNDCQNGLFAGIWWDDEVGYCRDDFESGDADADGPAAITPTETSGCGCVAAGAERSPVAALLVWLLLAVLG